MTDDVPEEVFAAWAARAETGEVLDFEVLVGERPSIASELRRLHDDWRLFAPLLGRVVPGLLRSADGVPMPPLSGIGQDSTTPLSSELLTRLGIHAPNEGRYRFRSVIGHGGGGVVLKVWDTKLNRALAMKVVLGQVNSPSGSATPPVDGRVLTRFVDEARIASQLNHPGIVPVHELGADEAGRAFFTMKLVQGEDLAVVLSRVKSGQGDWSVTRTLGVILKVCEAVGYAHDRGVVHRDLKPANIMVGQYGEVYVMDWGLARVLNRAPGEDTVVNSVRQTERSQTPTSLLLTMEGAALGTPIYMSPEQARGDLSAVGAPSDVYSIGAIIYELLSGQMPYILPETERSASAVLALLLQGPPIPIQQLVPKAPPELVAICERAMARRQEDRYPNVLMLANDLRAYLENRVVTAHATGPWAEARKWVSRNRALAGASAALIIALVLGIVIPLEVSKQASRRELLISDSRLATQLKTSAETMSWAKPEDLDTLHSWLVGADGLARRREEHRRLLGELESNPLELFHANQLRELIQTTGPAVAELRSTIAFREDFARTVDEQSIGGPEAQKLWRDAINGIERSKRYGGLILSPQMGLLPIGVDPQSGLWEFAHLQTGVPAERGSDGRLALHAETGLVFVLIPACTFWMGAQNIDKAGINYDPMARSDVYPPHEVSLSPYFLSKYEMTQGQWFRMARNNPSFHQADNWQSEWTNDAVGWTPLHPVEKVSWSQCVELLGRLGLTLPTEAQWECGARGGCGLPYWTGADPASLRNMANLADSRAYGTEEDWPDCDLTLDDGNSRHAEVGSYSENPFGLQDVYGNVWEWCLDGYEAGFYSRSPRADPVVPWSRWNPDGTYRGGSFANSALTARSANRGHNSVGGDAFDLGLRPARIVVR